MTQATYRKRTTLTIEVEVDIVVEVTHDPGRQPDMNQPGDPPYDNIDNIETTWKYETVCDDIKAAAVECVDEGNFSDGSWTQQ